VGWRAGAVLSGRRLVRGALAGAALALAGCGIQPMAFPGSPGEIGNRPGLISGDTGSLAICCHATPVPAVTQAGAPAKPPQ
jgi:hypothetical protein